MISYESILLKTSFSIGIETFQDQGKYEVRFKNASSTDSIWHQKIKHTLICLKFLPCRSLLMYVFFPFFLDNMVPNMYWYEYSGVQWFLQLDSTNLSMVA